MQTKLKGIDLAKFLAAQRASQMVEDGMRVGLGTGSTAFWLVKCLAERAKSEGLKIECVPTSQRTAEQARTEGLRLAPEGTVGRLDLTIDGADEIDPQMNLIKGGGGALLREKIVAFASESLIVIADGAKMVRHLGAYPLPIEIVRFGWETTVSEIDELLQSADVGGRTLMRRMAGEKPFVTDEGHYIIDLHAKVILRPEGLARALNQIPGVVENGLFTGLCQSVVLGYEDGHVEVRSAPSLCDEDTEAAR